MINILNTIIEYRRNDDLKGLEDYFLNLSKQDAEDVKIFAKALLDVADNQLLRYEMIDRLQSK